MHVFKNSLALTRFLLCDVEDSNDDGFLYLTQLGFVRCGAFLSGEVKAPFLLTTYGDSLIPPGGVIILVLRLKVSL